MKYEENESFDSLVGLAFSKCPQRDAELFMSVDTSGIAANPALDRRVRRIIGQKTAEGAGWRTRSIVWRIAVAVMIASAFMIITLVSISGSKNYAYKMTFHTEGNVMCVTFDKNGAESSVSRVEISVNEEEKATHISYEGKDARDLPDIDALINAALKESNLEEKDQLVSIVTPFFKKPSYSPEGTTQQISEMRISNSIQYFSGNDMVCLYAQTVFMDPLITMNAKNVRFETVEINGCEAIVGYNVKTGWIEMAWADETWLYQMVFTGSTGYAEALAMARSVK